MLQQIFLLGGSGPLQGAASWKGRPSVQEEVCDLH